MVTQGLLPYSGSGIKTGELAVRGIDTSGPWSPRGNPPSARLADDCTRLKNTVNSTIIAAKPLITILYFILAPFREDALNEKRGWTAVVKRLPNTHFPLLNQAKRRSSTKFLYLLQLFRSNTFPYICNYTDKSTIR